MLRRRIAITAIALFTMVVSLAGATTLAQAAPATVYGVPSEGAKVTLDEMSIDGPALAATYAPATVLAWTGTDTYHRLNLMTSSDGLHYGNKVILPEYSLWRPAIAFIDSGRGAPYGTIVMAWTGTDANHTLNLAFIKTPEYTITQKITLWGETSFTAPALATVNGDINSDIYLSWAGTDNAHTVNILHRTTNPVAQSKHIFWGWSSISRPNLSTDRTPHSATQMLLSWTGVNNRIYFADTTDRVTWSMPSASPLAIQTAWAPSMIGFQATAIPTRWLAWTGSGATSTRLISVGYSENYPSWGDQAATTTLREWAISSPALAYNSADGTSHNVLLAWTGVDPAHSLNVAFVSA